MFFIGIKSSLRMLRVDLCIRVMTGSSTQRLQVFRSQIL